MAGRNVARQIIASTVRGYGDRLRADLGQTATGPALVEGVQNSVSRG